MKQLTSYEGLHCANCGAAMQGEFCHECGQSIKSVIQPVSHMLEDAGARVVITGQGTKERLPDQTGGEVVDLDSQREELLRWRDALFVWRSDHRRRSRSDGARTSARYRCHGYPHAGTHGR